MRKERLFPRQFVVAGTDTGVGKTVIAAMLVAGLRSSYWKPVQSGLEEATDTERVRDLSGLPADCYLPEAYRLKAPLSPHAAAAREGITIEPARLALPLVPGRLVVEGAGGLMVPLAEQTLLIDVIRDWGLPVLLVARSRLGTINHSLLSLAALRAYGIEVLGVVMNGPRDEISRRAIEGYGKIRVVAEVPILKDLDAAAIKAAYDRLFGSY